MTKRVVVTDRVVRLPNGELMAALPEPPAFSRDWPELAWLMAYGG